MKPLAITLISVSLLFAGSSTWAEGIIGSVDKKGNVTFSDRVPEDAVKSKEVKVDPVYPSQASQEAARATTQQMIDAADQSRESVENVRAVREELAEKRRISIEADSQRSQEMAPVSPDDGYVIDRAGYVTDTEPGYVSDLGPGDVSNLGPGDVSNLGPEDVSDQGPGYVSEREPNYIE